MPLSQTLSNNAMMNKFACSAPKQIWEFRYAFDPYLLKTATSAPPGVIIIGMLQHHFLADMGFEEMLVKWWSNGMN
jgi:hypothetical protein